MHVCMHTYVQYKIQCTCTCITRNSYQEYINKSHILLAERLDQNVLHVHTVDFSCVGKFRGGPDNINSVYCLLSGHKTPSTKFSNATEIHCISLK